MPKNKNPKQTKQQNQTNKTKKKTHQQLELFIKRLKVGVAVCKRNLK